MPVTLQPAEPSHNVNGQDTPTYILTDTYHVQSQSVDVEEPTTAAEAWDEIDTDRIQRLRVEVDEQASAAEVGCEPRPELPKTPPMRSAMPKMFPAK